MSILKIKHFAHTLIFCFYALCLGIFLSIMPLYFLQSNPIKNQGKVNLAIFSFVPQGWAFFTRDPREAQILIFKKNENKSFSIDSQKQNALANYFGLKRRPSQMLAEFQFAKEEIPNFLYFDTVFNYQKDFELESPSKLKTYNHVNKLKHPALCGEYVIVLQKPIPWSWVENINKVKMPAKMIKINFICG